MFARVLRFSCALFLACLMVVATGGLVNADEDLFQEVPAPLTSPNQDPLAATAESATYTFSIGPGGSYWNTGMLEGEYPADCGLGSDYDTYIMTVTATATVSVELIDCCLMGDTICLAKSPAVKKCALSPDTVVVSGTLAPGTYTFYVAYHGETTCEFPAGYDIYVSAQ